MQCVPYTTAGCRELVQVSVQCGQESLLFVVSGAEEIMQKVIPARFREKLLSVGGVELRAAVDKKKIQVEIEGSSRK